MNVSLIKNIAQSPLFLILVFSAGIMLSANAQKIVYVNGARLTAQTIYTLEYSYRTQIRNGRYWYDAQTGWWGIEGQPPAGIIMSGLNFGRGMHVKVSGGNTGIYVNGRELNSREVPYYTALIGRRLPRGRYSADAYGNFGPQGGYAVCNLYQLAQAQYRASGGSRNSFWYSGATGNGYGSNGKDFYIMGDGFSYTNF